MREQDGSDQRLGAGGTQRDWPKGTRFQLCRVDEFQRYSKYNTGYIVINTVLYTLKFARE